MKVGQEYINTIYHNEPLYFNLVKVENRTVKYATGKVKRVDVVLHFVNKNIKKEDWSPALYNKLSKFRIKQEHFEELINNHIIKLKNGNDG